MSKVWFTGCTHFGHANIIRLASRPFESVESMDAQLIERWNACVKEGDTVYHLGDFTWYKGAQAEAVRDKLNGKIILILGNHDPADAGSLFPTHNYLEIPNMGPDGVVLFHYPMEDWNGRWRGSIHLHAHTHEPWFTRPKPPRIPHEGFRREGEVPGGTPASYPKDITCNRFHVGVDARALSFAPISLDQLVEYSRGNLFRDFNA